MAIDLNLNRFRLSQRYVLLYCNFWCFISQLLPACIFKDFRLRILKFVYCTYISNTYYQCVEAEFIIKTDITELFIFDCIYSFKYYFLRALSSCYELQFHEKGPCTCYKYLLQIIILLNTGNMYFLMSFRLRVPLLTSVVLS